MDNTVERSTSASPSAANGKVSELNLQSEGKSRLKSKSKSKSLSKSPSSNLPVPNPHITNNIDQVLENDDLMDIDDDDDGNKEETKSKEDKKILNERIRDEKLEEMDKQINEMSNINLEIVPLLLDIIEQIKVGDLPVKDADNACGRIRLRLNKLQEIRNQVENGLSSMKSSFPDTDKLQVNIEMKESCLNSISIQIRDHLTQ